MDSFNWTLISFYTPLYDKIKDRLVSSCHAFDLPFVIERHEDQGSWEANCCYKAAFILDKLLERKEPVLWVDADAEIVNALPRSFEGDFGTIINTHLDSLHPSQVISGVVYAAYTENSVRILKKWIAWCEAFDGKEWDQVALREAIKGEEVFSLPKSYYAVFDKKQVEPPVIVHYQASRMTKKIQRGEVVNFFAGEE